MTTEKLDALHHAQPFRPFTIHTADGRSFYVKHPDFLSRSPAGRTVMVHGDDGESMSILDLLLITELEVHKPAKRSPAA